MVGEIDSFNDRRKQLLSITSILRIFMHFMHIWKCTIAQYEYNMKKYVKYLKYSAWYSTR